MDNDSGKTNNMIIEATYHWEAVRDFFGGGIREMQRHPAWFRRNAYRLLGGYLECMIKEANDYLEQEGEGVSVVNESLMEAFQGQTVNRMTVG